jgi:sphinganine-1-phosphate aldolase
MTIVSFASKVVNIFKVADSLDEKGFKVEKQSNPDCIHLSVMPQHEGIADELVKTINEAVADVKANPNKYETGTKALYGMMAKIPDEVLVEEFMHFFMDEVYKFH